MRRSLRLEFIGHDLWSLFHVRGMKPWVAEVSFNGIEVIDRRFVEGMTEYAYANKLGWEGVYLYFACEEGRVHEVYDRARLRGPRRVFMVHDGSKWLELQREEAARWPSRSAA